MASRGAKSAIVALGLTLVALTAVADTPEERSQAVGRIAKRELRKGMTTKQVRSRLGKPLGRDTYCGRAEVWTYVTSTSGTWSYIVGFVDGEVATFGEANPQWLGDDDYRYEGADRLREIVRAADSGACARVH
jgi:outer membrane protein assembly factor BamE (lipoprotein component of BamABCDE complex)